MISVAEEAEGVPVPSQGKEKRQAKCRKREEKKDDQVHIQNGETIATARPGRQIEAYRFQAEAEDPDTRVQAATIKAPEQPDAEGADPAVPNSKAQMDTSATREDKEARQSSTARQAEAKECQAPRENNQQKHFAD